MTFYDAKRILYTLNVLRTFELYRCVRASTQLIHSIFGDGLAEEENFRKNLVDNLPGELLEQQRRRSIRRRVLLDCTQFSKIVPEGEETNHAEFVIRTQG